VAHQSDQGDGVLLLKRLLSIGAATACLSFGALVPAAHAADTGCFLWDASGSNCNSGYVTVYVSEDQNVQFTLVQDGSGQIIAICTWTDGTQVPCIHGQRYSNTPGYPQLLRPEGWWSSSRHCYMFETDALPTDPFFQSISGGATNGKLYFCQLPDPIAGPSPYVWAENPPEPADGVYIELTARAVQTLNLHGITVGMTPPVAQTDPNAIGLVGAPTWLWVKDPTAQTWGPAAASSSSNSLTVSVSAMSKKVTWDVGDGTPPIICYSAGTAWQPGYGTQPSPDCGRPSGYQQSGTYPVSAKTHWVIDWSSNNGKSGQVAMDLTTTTTVTIAEAQVINR